MLVVGGAENHRRRIGQLRQMVGCLQPVEHRHRDVQDHCIGHQPGGQLAGFAPVRGLAHHLVSADVRDQVTQSAAGEGLIVGDQQFHQSNGTNRVAA